MLHHFLCKEIIMEKIKQEDVALIDKINTPSTVQLKDYFEINTTFNTWSIFQLQDYFKIRISILHEKHVEVIK